MTDFPFSVFLTPAPDDFRILRKTICDLSCRFASPVFDPHVTLYGGRFPKPELMAPVLAAAEGIGSFSLPVRGIGYEDQVFKCFYLDLEEAPPVRELHDRIRRRVPFASGYRMVPHLSLMYGTIPREEKALLAREMETVSEIVFDRVRLVAPGDPQKGWLDTSGWRTLAERQLG